MHRPLPTVLSIALLAGCVSGHAYFYRPLLPEATTLAGPVEVWLSDDLALDYARAQARGYRLVGFSRFDGPREGEAEARAQARSVGASLVLMAFDVGTHRPRARDPELTPPPRRPTLDEARAMARGGGRSAAVVDTIDGALRARADQLTLFLRPTDPALGTAPSPFRPAH